MNLKQMATLLNVSYPYEASITGVSIDSRQLKPGNVFVAINGERFDGHDFIEDAVAKGAIAVICSQPNDAMNIPQFIVPNTLQALTKIAVAYRNTLHCPIIALTGSNGKTTVKDMIANMLPAPSYATRGNFNNHIGVPLSLLQLNETHRYAVFELGANHLGEIAYTAGMVRPQVALINNIAPAHIGEFGSIDAVARTKGEIYQAIDKEGVAVINEDDEYAHFWDGIVKDKKTLRFSLSTPMDVYARDLTYNKEGCAEFDLVTHNDYARVVLNVPGEHTVRNALAAASCCYALNLPLASTVKGLENFRGVPGRMTFLKGKHQSCLIDDSYNANLRSVLTAIDVLAQRGGRRILVLGDMGELGEWTKPHHEQVGVAAYDKGIDVVMTCGVHSLHTSEAFNGHATHYLNQDELAQDLLSQLDENTTVLIKGSRSAKMERIVRQLLSEST